MSADRTVHCTIDPESDNPIEIVRYDRAGKWFYESRTKRRPLRFEQAVAYAVEDRPSVIWHAGLPGGSRFDIHVRVARKRRERHVKRGITPVPSRDAS
jgi:hypothetical protein